MNKKLKTLCYSLMLIIGVCFTTNVSAKVCYYGHTASGYANSGYTNMSDYSKIQVSYDSSTICYYINGDTGSCFAANNYQTASSRTYKVTNSVPLSTWIEDSDGCIDNLHIASATYRESDYVTAYQFTTNTNSVTLGYHVTATPSPAIFLSASDKIRVTFKLPKGNYQIKEVDFGGTVSSIGVPEMNNGEIFDCWKLSGNTQCYDFTKPVKTDITLVAAAEKAKDDSSGNSSGNKVTVNAGFLGISNKEVLCGEFTIPYGLPYIMHKVIDLIKLITPIILIVLGMVDYGKATMSNDENAMKKSSAAFVRRVIAAVVIFFAVALVQFGFSLLGSEKNNIFSCFDCFVNDSCNFK